MARFDVAVEPAAREGSFFFHIEDGYHYYWNDEDKNGTIYFKCVQYGKGCRGRASLSPDKGFFHIQAHQCRRSLVRWRRVDVVVRWRHHVAIASAQNTSARKRRRPQATRRQAHIGAA